MVGRRFVRGAWRLLRTHRGHDFPRQVSGVQFLLKKKINVKSSTEGEIIGVYEAMSKILCSRYSIEAQGYNVSYNKLMQYNNSAILLENNGKFSRSNKTKHIKAGYFFVMDRVAQVDL